MIGTKIKQLREDLKLSQEELGIKVGIDQTLISRVERSIRKVNANELVLFSRALGVTVSELLEESV